MGGSQRDIRQTDSSINGQFESEIFPGTETSAPADSSPHLGDESSLPSLSAMLWVKKRNVEKAQAEVEIAAATVKATFKKIRDSSELESVQMFIDEVYWNDLLTSDDLREILGLKSVSQLSKETKPAFVHIEMCRMCGTDIGPVYAKSKSERGAILRDFRATIDPSLRRRSWTKQPLCSSCHAEQDVKWMQEKSERERQFEERLSRLYELSTMPYSEYLLTQEWKSTRLAALKRAKFSCQLCNAKGVLHVHHRTYENRGHEPPSDLIVLCADCHAYYHGFES